MTSTLVHIESYWISWWSVLLRWRHNKPFHGIEICGWMWVTIGALSQYSATLPHVWPPGSAQWEPSRLLGSPHPSERTSTRGLFWYILNYIKYIYIYMYIYIDICMYTCVCVILWLLYCCQSVSLGAIRHADNKIWHRRLCICIPFCIAFAQPRSFRAGWAAPSVVRTLLT